MRCLKLRHEGFISGLFIAATYHPATSDTGLSFFILTWVIGNSRTTVFEVLGLVPPQERLKQTSYNELADPLLIDIF